MRYSSSIYFHPQTVKQPKLTGEPCQVFRETALVHGMFTYSLEVPGFKGADGADQARGGHRERERERADILYNSEAKGVQSVSQAADCQELAEDVAAHPPAQDCGEVEEATAVEDVDNPDGGQGLQAVRGEVPSCGWANRQQEAIACSGGQEVQASEGGQVGNHLGDHHREDQEGEEFQEARRWTEELKL